MREISVNISYFRKTCGNSDYIFCNVSSRELYIHTDRNIYLRIYHRILCDGMWAIIKVAKFYTICVRNTSLTSSWWGRCSLNTLGHFVYFSVSVFWHQIRVFSLFHQTLLLESLTPVIAWQWVRCHAITEAWCTMQIKKLFHPQSSRSWRPTTAMTSRLPEADVACKLFFVMQIALNCSPGR